MDNSKYPETLEVRVDWRHIKLGRNYDAKDRTKSRNCPIAAAISEKMNWGALVLLNCVYPLYSPYAAYPNYVKSVEEFRYDFVDQEAKEFIRRFDDGGYVNPITVRLKKVLIEENQASD